MPSEHRNYRITIAQTELDTPPPQKSPELIQRSIQAIPNHYLQTYLTYIINKKSELLISITGIACLYFLLGNLTSRLLRSTNHVVKNSKYKCLHLNKGYLAMSSETIRCTLLNLVRRYNRESTSKIRRYFKKFPHFFVCRVLVSVILLKLGSTVHHTLIV